MQRIDCSTKSKFLYEHKQFTPLLSPHGFIKMVKEEQARLFVGFGVIFLSQVLVDSCKYHLSHVSKPAFFPSGIYANKNLKHLRKRSIAHAESTAT